jgi:hypothetical protein
METEDIQAETPSSNNSSTFTTIPTEEQRNSAPLQSSFKSIQFDSKLDVGGRSSSSYKAAPTSNTYDSMEEAGEEVVMDDAEDLQVMPDTPEVVMDDAEDLRVVPDTPATPLVSQPNSISALFSPFIKNHDDISSPPVNRERLFGIPSPEASMASISSPDLIKPEADWSKLLIKKHALEAGGNIEQFCKIESVKIGIGFVRVQRSIKKIDLALPLAQLTDSDTLYLCNPFPEGDRSEDCQGCVVRKQSRGGYLVCGPCAVVQRLLNKTVSLVLDDNVKAKGVKQRKDGQQVIRLGVSEEKPKILKKLVLRNLVAGSFQANKET